MNDYHLSIAINPTTGQASIEGASVNVDMARDTEKRIAAKGLRAYRINLEGSGTVRLGYPACAELKVTMSYVSESELQLED